MELAVVLLFFFSIAFLCLGVLAFWWASDAVWRMQIRCTVLESNLASLNWRFMLLCNHVEHLTDCHNRFVNDFWANGSVQQRPPADDDWWREGKTPPWENN